MTCIEKCKLYWICLLATMVTQLEQMFCIVHLAIVGSLCLPMCIFCGSKLRKHWNDQFIIKRGKYLILAQYLLFTWHSFVEFPFFIGCFLANVPMSIYSFFGVFYVSVVAIRFISASTYLLRIYLLYFNHQYSKIVSQQKWQILIDPNIVNSNWFLINKKNRFGNPSYLVKWMLIPFCACNFAVFCVVIIFFGNHNGDLESDLFAVGFTSSFCIILVMIGTIIWRKYPKILDEWGIRKEMGLTIKVLTMFPILLCPAIVLKRFGIISPKLTLILTFIGLELIICAIFFLLVPYSSIKRSDKDSIQSSEIMMASTLQLQAQQSNRNITWQQIIKTNDGFEQFTCFLAKEFSTENILYCVEYIQLKQVMIDKPLLKNIIEKDLKLKYRLSLPESTPTSIIANKLSEFIHNESIKDCFIEAGKQLFTKYINPKTASMELNIDWRLRQKLIIAFKTLSNDELKDNYNDKQAIEMIMPLLEQTAEDVGLLINDSKVRFKRTSVFAELMLQNSDGNAK